MQGRVLVLVVCGVLLAGCGGDSSKIAHVSGQVTLNGQPVPHAAVSFQPLAPPGKMNAGPASGAITDAEGRFTLKLIPDGGDGAVVGKHNVSISPAKEESTADDHPKRARARAGQPHKRSQFEFVVPAGGTSSADFQLPSH